ncbi:MAG TPA: nuclear transport factor 2 family protein [Thermoanaerobaculia bacterium]
MQRLLFLVLLAAFPLRAQILTTEVWIGDLNLSEGRFEVSGLANISSKPGYDNQPAFFPDGSSLYYTTQALDLSDTGLGVHAVKYDLRSGVGTPLPSAFGFSPTPTADARQLTTLREGSVWLYDATGREIGRLTETNTAGYYTRFDDRTWVLFMNEPERRIVIYDAKTKKVETVATGAVTAPYRVPGQRAVTFVADEPFTPQPAADAPRPSRILRRLDLRGGKVTTLATIPFASGGQHVWTSRGTILIASGPRIFEWSPARPDDWRAIYTADHPDLQGITRIALSPAEDRIALVSVPRGETVIHESRKASNRALASRNPAGAASLFTANGLVVAADGTRREGREAIEKELTDRYSQIEDLVYIRTPDSIAVSRNRATGSEKGTWKGSWTSPEGPVALSGDYMAIWRNDIDSSGVPSWRVESELFVALDCEGSGCRQ